MRINEVAEQSSEISIIESYCTQYLKLIQNEYYWPLFRGTRSKGVSYIGHPPVDREPVDSNAYLTKLTDIELKARGVQARRTNSIFCTGDQNRASKYGHVYIIFPFNNYQYTTVDSKDLIINSRNLCRRECATFKPEIFAEMKALASSKSPHAHMYQSVARLSEDETLDILNVWHSLPPAAEVKRKYGIDETKVLDFNMRKYVDSLKVRTNVNINKEAESEREIWLHADYLAISESSQQFIDVLNYFDINGITNEYRG
jgi:hypothetical protein